jgi:hypothetical protein
LFDDREFSIWDSAKLQCYPKAARIASAWAGFEELQFHGLVGSTLLTVMRGELFKAALMVS